MVTYKYKKVIDFIEHFIVVFRKIAMLNSFLLFQQLIFSNLIESYWYFRLQHVHGIHITNYMLLIFSSTVCSRNSYYWLLLYHLLCLLQDSLGGNSKTVMIGNLSCQRLLQFLSFYLEFANISGIENSSPRIFVSLQKDLKKCCFSLHSPDFNNLFLLQLA